MADLTAPRPSGKGSNILARGLNCAAALVSELGGNAAHRAQPCPRPHAGIHAETTAQKRAHSDVPDDSAQQNDDRGACYTICGTEADNAEDDHCQLCSTKYEGGAFMAGHEIEVRGQPRGGVDHS